MIGQDGKIKKIKSAKLVVGYTLWHMFPPIHAGYECSVLKMCSPVAETVCIDVGLQWHTYVS